MAENASKGLKTAIFNKFDFFIGKELSEHQILESARSSCLSQILQTNFKWIYR